MAVTPNEEPWYAVRCIVQHDHPENAELRLYEERITLWRAASFEDAVERAQREVQEYAAILTDAKYVKLAQVFHLAIEGAVGDGDEIYSLMRESSLAPDDYLSRFFDTRSERDSEIK